LSICGGLATRRLRALLVRVARLYVRLLGRGGMGEVYRATDLTLGQAVALKFLPEATARDERMLARFYNEVRIARQVAHPNVCRVYDIGQVDGLHYISMEYVDGEDLGSLLRRYRVDRLRHRDSHSMGGYFGERASVQCALVRGAADRTASGHRHVIVIRFAVNLPANAGPQRVVYRAGADPAAGGGLHRDLRIPHIAGGPAAVPDFG
jgi:hypothetical protein